MTNMHNDKYPTLYVRFLNLVRAMQEASHAPALDADEERMLSFYAIEWAAGRSLPVTEAARLDPATAERTAFRRIKVLHSKGYVDFTGSEGDQRVRYIVPTAQTEQHFSRLSACMEIAQGGGEAKA